MCQRHYEKSLKQADTVIKVEWKRDTIYEPKDSIIYKVKPVYLAVHDTTEISDTVTVRDSVLVDVPITEKTYTCDDGNTYNYAEFISRYNKMDAPEGTQD